MLLLTLGLLASLAPPQSIQSVGTTQVATVRARSTMQANFDLLDASNGFGRLLPHSILQLDASGQPTANVVEIRTLDDLIANASPTNGVRPVTQWPTGTVLPNGQSGNHYAVARFTAPIDVSSVLDSSVSAAAVSQLTGAVAARAVNPATGQVMLLQGRAFVGGQTFGAPDPGNPGNLQLETWVGLGGGGQPQALAVGGGTPGLGFPGTESSFFGAGDLVAPNAFVFVADSDGDLTTHDVFPTGFQVQLVISNTVVSTGGCSLANRGLASATVGRDQLSPEVAFVGGPTVPAIVPGNGDAFVDPETNVTVQFVESVQPRSLGDLAGSTPSLSAAIQLSFGPAASVTTVPFTVAPESVYDLSRYVLNPVYAFPGSGAGASCGSFSQVDVTVNASQFQDLAGNFNQLGASTFFTTGPGPGLVNAPVTPDAIYLARLGSTPGLSVLDLNGFGASTGSPNFDFTQPIVQGNSNYPNNPNVTLQGSLFVPPLAPGSCTFDGGSAGVFSLTKDSNLSDLLVSAPLVESVGDMALGHGLDMTFNAAVPFGCQSGGGNLCATTGLKLVTLIQGGATTCRPAPVGTPPLATLQAVENLASWAPHPNPPPLVFPPLCLSPLIGGQEPTSVLTGLPPALGGVGLINLLVPGSNPLGNPAFGIPPSSLLALEQNAWFQGPSSPAPSIVQCQPFMLRQQIGQFLYLVDRVAGEVVVLNSNRCSVLDRIAMPDPTALAMGPNLDFLAVTNQAANELWFLDVDPSSSTFHQVVQTVQVGVEPRGVAWDPGNEDILVANSGDGTISIVSAFNLQVRKTLSGAIGDGTTSLDVPIDVVITQRQQGFGWLRSVYYAYVLDANGTLVLFESGPDGVNGWGYDDLIGAAPFTLTNPKAIQPDLANLKSAVWVAHEESLALDGSPTGLSGGAVTRVELESSYFGLVPLDPSNAGTPQLRGLDLCVGASIGSDVLTGIPTDLAFDDQRNLTALPNAGSTFSAGVSVAVNGKSLAKPFAGGFAPVSTPALLFVAVPNSSEGPGVVDVLGLAGPLGRVDTNPFAMGIQSIPASGVTGLAGYLRQ